MKVTLGQAGKVFLEQGAFLWKFEVQIVASLHLERTIDE
jgi:hypothetical protein